MCIADCRVLTGYYHAMLRMFVQEHEKYMRSDQQPLAFEPFVANLARDDNPNANVRYLARLKPYLEAYVGFYTAIRTGNWALRNACMERLGVLFFAYARPNYTKIVAQALVNKVMLPRTVLAQFEQGEWTVSMQGHRGANVALDESLEMGANR
jgi:hypothetical protein